MDVVGRIKIAAQHAFIRLSNQGFDHVTASRVVVLIITDRWGTHGPDVAILAVFSPSGFVGLDGWTGLHLVFEGFHHRLHMLGYPVEHLHQFTHREMHMMQRCKIELDLTERQAHDRSQGRDQKGGALMRAKHVHLISHFVFALSLCVCLVVSACSSAGTVLTQATPTVEVPAFAVKLQPLLVAKMQQLRIPGAIIYVDDPGQGSWITTLGTSDLATRAPMNVNSHMRIGSITKTFTATVILQLVDEGKLRLDDPVAKYLPQVPNGANITIRELLNMTSGLFNYSNDQGFQQADPSRVWDPKELVAIAFRHRPYFAPGQGLHYTNTNYILLGMLIEQIPGMPVEKAFQQRIFTPLGMESSSFPPLASSAIPDPHPHGYVLAETLGRAGAPLDV